MEWSTVLYENSSFQALVLLVLHNHYMDPTRQVKSQTTSTSSTYFTDLHSMPEFLDAKRSVKSVKPFPNRSCPKFTRPPWPGRSLAKLLCCEPVLQDLHQPTTSQLWPQRPHFHGRWIDVFFFWFVLLFLQETLRKPKKTYCLLRFHLWMVCFISTNSRWLQPSNAWHHRDWAQRFQTELPTSASAHLAPLTESGWRLGAGCCRNSSSVKPQSPASRSHPTGAFKDKLPQISSSSSDIRNEASLWNVSNIQMVQTKE